MIDTGGDKIETYTWICGDQQCDTIDCFKSRDNRQTVCKLWSLGAPSDFHDAELADATKKINAVIARLEKGNRDRTRKLSFVQHRNRLMLVWASYGRVGPDDDFKVIKKALKLRR